MKGSPLLGRKILFCIWKCVRGLYLVFWPAVLLFLWLQLLVRSGEPVLGWQGVEEFFTGWGGVVISVTVVFAAGFYLFVCRRNKALWAVRSVVVILVIFGTREMFSKKDPADIVFFCGNDLYTTSVSPTTLGSSSPSPTPTQTPSVP